MFRVRLIIRGRPQDSTHPGVDPSNAMVTSAGLRDRAWCTCSALLVLSLAGASAFTNFVPSPRSSDGITRRSGAVVSATAAPPGPSTSDNLQHICDRLLVDGAELKDVERLVMNIEANIFPQASAWSKTWTPMRAIIAEVEDGMSISVLVLPRGSKLEWQRHDKAESVSKILFGSVQVADLEIEGSDNARKLEQQELERVYTDAWAVGGSDESDCVCRGGRCPRMWDCPFWVDRRRAEAKGSSAHVATRVPQEIPSSEFWRAGRETVRRVEALEPSALLEVHLGIRSTRFYQEISSTSQESAELIEVLTPIGVKPGVCRYLGPSVHFPE